MLHLTPFISLTVYLLIYRPTSTLPSTNNIFPNFWHITQFLQYRLTYRIQSKNLLKALFSKCCRDFHILTNLSHTCHFITYYPPLAYHLAYQMLAKLITYCPNSNLQANYSHTAKIHDQNSNILPLNFRDRPNNQCPVHT